MAQTPVIIKTELQVSKKNKGIMECPRVLHIFLQLTSPNRVFKNRRGQPKIKNSLPETSSEFP